MCALASSLTENKSDWRLLQVETEVMSLEYDANTSSLCRQARQTVTPYTRDLEQFRPNVLSRRHAQQPVGDDEVEFLVSHRHHRRLACCFDNLALYRIYISPPTILWAQYHHNNTLGH